MPGGLQYPASANTSSPAWNANLPNLSAVLAPFHDLIPAGTKRNSFTSESLLGRSLALEPWRIQPCRLPVRPQLLGWPCRVHTGHAFEPFGGSCARLLDR